MLISLMTVTQCLEDMWVAGILSRLYTPCHEAADKNAGRRRSKRQKTFKMNRSQKMMLSFKNQAGDVAQQVKVLA